MNFKSVLAASAVATLPMMASAAIVPITNGGTTNAVFGDTYTFTGFSSGPFTHTFNVQNSGAGVAAVSMDELLADFFSMTTFAWANGQSSTLDANGDAVVSTLFDGGSDVLTLSFAPSTSTGVSYSGSIQISAVPVPAGLLLMGTALAGLGAMRRKKV